MNDFYSSCIQSHIIKIENCETIWIRLWDFCLWGKNMCCGLTLTTSYRLFTLAGAILKIYRKNNITSYFWLKKYDTVQCKWPHSFRLQPIFIAGLKYVSNPYSQTLKINLLRVHLFKFQKYYSPLSEDSFVCTGNKLPAKLKGNFRLRYFTQIQNCQLPYSPSLIPNSSLQVNCPFRRKHQNIIFDYRQVINLTKDCHPAAITRHFMLPSLCCGSQRLKANCN